MFRVMDMDHNGYFNSFELRIAMLSLGKLPDTRCSNLTNFR